MQSLHTIIQNQSWYTHTHYMQKVALSDRKPHMQSLPCQSDSVKQEIKAVNSDTAAQKIPIGVIFFCLLLVANK